MGARIIGLVCNRSDVGEAAIVIDLPMRCAAHNVFESERFVFWHFDE